MSERPLTVSEERVLKSVRGTRTGITAAEIGRLLWQGDRWMSARSTSANRFARPAGKILKALEARGLVFVRVCGTQFRWFPQ